MLMCCAFSCTTNENDLFPYASVNLELDLTYEDKALKESMAYKAYIMGQTTGLSAVERTGFGGVIVYHDLYGYSAYDLACPYEMKYAIRVEIDESRLNEIELISYVYGNKSEIWFKFPTAEDNRILIFDYLNGEWVERKAQDDIKALALIRGGLYSASGAKILKEYIGSTFDGVYIPSEYKTNVINLNSDSNIKVPKMPLILTLDYDCENDFYMEFIYDDMPNKSRKKHIVKLMKGYLIWSKSAGDENGGLWALDENDANGGIWVSSDKNTVMFNLDGVLHFKQLQIRIYTMESPQEFAIKRLELKRVRLKTKSLG